MLLCLTFHIGYDVYVLLLLCMKSQLWVLEVNFALQLNMRTVGETVEHVGSPLLERGSQVASSLVLPSFTFCLYPAAPERECWAGGRLPAFLASLALLRYVTGGSHFTTQVTLSSVLWE